MRDSVFGGPQGIWHHHQLHPNSSFRATAQASDLPRRPPWGYTLGMPPLRQPEEFRAFFGLQRPRQWFCLRCQKRLFGASPEAATNGQASLYPPPGIGRRNWPNSAWGTLKSPHGQISEAPLPASHGLPMQPHSARFITMPVPRIPPHANAARGAQPGCKVLNVLCTSTSSPRSHHTAPLSEVHLHACPMDAPPANAARGAQMGCKSAGCVPPWGGLD
jgi:hypothetical protein